MAKRRGPTERNAAPCDATVGGSAGVDATPLFLAGPPHRDHLCRLTKVVPTKLGPERPLLSRLRGTDSDGHCPSGHLGIAPRASAGILGCHLRGADVGGSD